MTIPEEVQRDVKQALEQPKLDDATIEKPVELAPSSPPRVAPTDAPRSAGLRKAKQSVLAPKGAIKATVTSTSTDDQELTKIDPTWSENVTSEGVSEAWAKFVEQLRSNDRLALVATMSLGNPQLDENRVIYTVNNPLQSEQMGGLRTEVLMHLKKELKNASLELHIDIIEQSVKEKKAFLSDKDRYDMMVEKNPALEKLRKALDLDLG